MEKIIAVKNFVTFAAPLSMLLICKVVLPTNMYESLVDFTADNFFMVSRQENRGLSDMYNNSISPRTFLRWTTSNMNSIRSTFSSMLLELYCPAQVGHRIDEEIEFVEYNTLNPIPMSKILHEDKPTVINIGSTS